MKKEKKEKLLKKYLTKKEKQKKRDELFVELKKYETKDKSPVKIDVKIKNKAKKEKYKNITFKLNKLDENKLVAPKPDNTDVIEPEVKLEIAEFDTSIATGMKEQMENYEKKTDNITTEQNEGIDDIFLNLKKPKLQRSKKVEMERKKLPVYYEEENIVTKIKQYDVSVIQGPTGCGKSTQIPQFIFENGLNRGRKILITQPRRLAAINISKRIGYELNTNVCGYQIRHESTVDSRTLIKVVTEGIMLNEIKNDFLLSDYTFIIMDEIHEKTANSEIILALLKQIQKERAKRNDPLKIILMSADVKIDDYQLIFDNKIGKIALESNSHKVDVFYEKETPRDYLRAAYEKIVNILKDDKYSRVAENEHLGILVFVPGKEDIYSLIRMVKELKLNITLLPLHSSLPFAKQNHMYHAFTNTTIIVSTNIAETSLTIPGISIVIDTGLAKFKQLTLDKSYCYSVNYISKSSANQRKGRAGRVSDGLCFRLYSSKLFDMLREAEQPEILNMRLETHILALKAMGIDNIRSLVGLVAIPDKNIQSGLKALENYGAIDKKGVINEMGQKMAQIPLDARYARMVLTKCIYTDYLILAASILTYDFDVMNNSQTVKFCSNCKSDIIVKMRIIIDYNYCEDKQEFAKQHKISSNTMDEIIKLYKQLCCIVGLPKVFVKHMDTDIELKLLEIFTLTFCDNLAVSCGDYYTYNNVIVHTSKHSAKLDSKYIVFDHIIEGRSKVYIKNISCAESLVQ